MGVFKIYAIPLFVAPVVLSNTIMVIIVEKCNLEILETRVPIHTSYNLPRGLIVQLNIFILLCIKYHY